ncbi:MAG TPA: hypothetical protein PL188_10930 [Candidatus Cloacimonadota bacterium]|nr:hypothetical protein [Candidatus Cloacimonadota bacterium]
MGYSEKIKTLQSLANDISDDRIEMLATLSEAQVLKYLGTEGFARYQDDPRLEYAICALSIARLIPTSRGIHEDSSVHSSTGWGEGNIAHSEVSELIRLSKYWEAQANQTLSQLRAEIPADLGWIDI